ncbi:MAG: biotin/lipoate A/B protein ligase family protein [Phycisphaerae bacterium]|nr:biotin/lipoate A/B protein ligase family protein [Phycisphaerae bacterium]
MQPMRLILDGAGDGAWNMGVDEAMLGGGATLRFYQWRPATISLGYFQPIDAYDARAAELAGFGLVRRVTGGGAILHDDELTYSLAVPADWPVLAGEAVRLYRLAHEAILGGLTALGLAAGFHEGAVAGNAQRGPFFCFARRHTYDLVVGKDKIVGSAQRRRPKAILQHGSIMLRRRGPQPCTGVNDHRASAVSADELAAILIPRFGAALEADLVPAELTSAETAAAEALADRHATAAWVRQR